MFESRETEASHKESIFEGAFILGGAGRKEWILRWCMHGVRKREEREKKIIRDRQRGWAGTVGGKIGGYASEEIAMISAVLTKS